VDLARYKTAKAPKYLYGKRAALLAAAVCLITVLSTAAFAANYWLGLEGLALPSRAGTPYTRGTMISLQGYADSPEYKALAEWREFCASYDEDGAILAGIGNNDTGLGEVYFIYGCYTREMAERLDAIAGKYGLSLHGGMRFIPDVDEFIAAVARGNFLGGALAAYPGYVYEDGTFRFEGDVADNEPYGVASPYDFSRVSFQFRSCRKGSMDYVALNIGNFYDYTEWTYNTASGVFVCLAQSPNLSLIIAELDDAFVTVNVHAGFASDGKDFSASGLEALADAIDFSLLK
jgi:hypothetical protein